MVVERQVRVVRFVLLYLACVVGNTCSALQRPLLGSKLRRPNLSKRYQSVPRR